MPKYLKHDTENQTGWHSGKDQGWLDSCGVEGQERRVHVDKHSRSTQRRQFSGWTRKHNKAGNCGPLQSPHGYVDKACRMANRYTANRRTWKWTKNSFSTCSTWQFSTATSCCLHVVGRNLTQRFSTRPCQGDAGKCWAWTPTIQGCRETCPCICEHWQIGYTKQQALEEPQPDQEAMSRVFRARCNVNGEV